jgi:tyrosine-protein phosphatase SIW14
MNGANNRMGPSRVSGLLIVTFAAAWVPTAAQVPTLSTPRQSVRSTVSAAGAPAERLQRPGVPRLARVTNHLYRGGQPDSLGLAELKTLSVNLVVNLRHEPAEIANERALVEARGMGYASIPWRGKENPRPQQVAEFLDLLRANSDKTVFVHCERGAERTGVMIAAYRISAEGWTPDQALAEMDVFGFRGLWFGHLKRFVRELPTLLTREPFLRKSARHTR